MTGYHFEYEGEHGAGAFEIEAPSEAAAIAKAKRKVAGLQKQHGMHALMGYIMTSAEPQEPVGTIHAYGEFVSFERYA